MRAFVDQILDSIGAASLNDEEFELITETVQEFSKALYDEIMLVLDSRETVSNTRDRLTALFTAYGADVTESSAGSSKIYLGDAL